jgi:hypothetical protein
MMFESWIAGEVEECKQQLGTAQELDTVKRLSSLTTKFEPLWDISHWPGSATRPGQGWGRKGSYW